MTNKEYYKQNKNKWKIYSKRADQKRKHKPARKKYMKKYLKQYWKTEKYKELKRNRYYKDRVQGLERKYGMKPGDYEEMLKQQKGCCAICKRSDFDKKPKKRRYFLNVDHCHITGKIRGLLCTKCNQHLGWHEKHSEQILGYLNE